MAHIDEIVMKKTTEKRKRPVKDGEKDGVKDGKKDGEKDEVKDGVKDGEKDGVKDGVKDGEKDEVKDGVKDGEKDGVKDGVKDGMNNGLKSGKKLKRQRATHLKSSESGRRNSGEMEGASEEKRTRGQKEAGRKTKPKKRREERGRDESGDGEKRARRGSVDEKESQSLKKNRGQENSKKNVRVWSASYSSTVDLIGGEKNKQRTRRRERDEEDECAQRDQRDESSDRDQYVSWVQCSKPECGKWRRLSDGVDPSVLPDDWNCQNNTDPTFSSCSALEERSNVPEEEMFFYSLVPGSLVWARQSGYPWWPAIVERDPNTAEYLEFRMESDVTPYKCHVTFFGEPVTRAWVICSRIRDYAALPADQIINDFDKGLKDSIHMSKEALTLSLKERLMKFGFHSRYISDRESSEDTDIADMLEQFCGKAENDCSDDSDEDLWNKKQRSGGRKQKWRKREGKKSRWGKEGDEKYRKGEKKKRVKKVKDGKEGEKGEEDTADQTVPQNTMETSTDMTFDLDIYSEGEEMERKRDRIQCGAEGQERVTGERREDEDEDDEKKEDRFSLLLPREE